MFKKGDFTGYLLSVLMGISATELLTMKFWGSAWWQVAIACAVGVIAGLFIADHRAMIVIGQKTVKKSMAFLKTAGECWEGKKLHQANWSGRGKKIAGVAWRISGAVARLFCFLLLYSLTSAIFFVFLGHPFSYGFNFISIGHISAGAGMPLLFLAISWMWIWFSPYGSIANNNSKTEGLAREKEIISENWRLLRFLPLWYLRISLSILVYLGMIVAAIALFFGNFAAEIWGRKKLLFVGICIVAGALFGTWLNYFLTRQISFLAGLLCGGIIFCAGYAADRFRIPAVSAPFFWAHGWLKEIPMPNVFQS
ncbi:MAG: hypothetical protein PHE24_02515 [Patescibacteria group bacterium]|nr:hypothetical protein [Patescibacteria group bacterium]